MDDYQTYLNALQSSDYITQLNQFNKQVAASKKESDISGGSFMTTEGIQEGLTKAIGAIRTKISDTATGLINKASESAKGAISTAKEAATDAAQSAVKTGEQAATGAVQTVKQVATDAVKTGQQITTDAVKTGQQITTDAVQTGQQITTDAVQAGQQITTDAVQSEQPIATGVAPAADAEQPAAASAATDATQTADAIPSQDDALVILSQQERRAPTNDLLPEGAGQIEDGPPAPIAPVADTQMTESHAQAVEGAVGDTEARTGTQITGGYEELAQSARAPRFQQLSTDISNEFEEGGDILGGSSNRLLGSGFLRLTEPVIQETQQAARVANPLIDAAQQGAAGAQAAATDAATAVSNGASSAVATLASNASAAVDDAAQAVGSAVASAATTATGAIDGAAAAVSSGIATAGNVATTAATTAIDTAATAATAGVDAVAAGLGATVSEALGELGPIGLILGGIGGGLAQLFEGAKEHANQAPILNPAFQFL